MAEITEEELSKAINGEDSQEDGGILGDLQREFAEFEEKAEEKVEEKEPEHDTTVTEDELGPSAESEPAEEPKTEEPAEPETPAEEPAKEEAPAEPELILGKFKTQDDLVKAYQNLEKRFGEKSQEVKQVEKATSDDFDKAVNAKIVEENMKLVSRAFETITDPEQAKEAQYLWYQAQRTGDAALFEKARGFLDARVDRRLEAEMTNTAAQIRMQANEHRQEILMKPLAEELDKMAEEDPDFMNDTQNQNLLAMAIKLNPSTVDVRAVKKAIQEYNDVSYKRGYEAAKKEFAKQAEKKAVSVKSTTVVEQPKPKKSPDMMTIEEQLNEEMKSLL